MELNLQNIKEAKRKLSSCDVSTFRSAGESFVHFISKMNVINFRHLHNLDVEFRHPVSVISGSNKIGKTSLLILLACSHENFLKIDSTSPNSDLRKHVWKDVINFTAHESESKDYSYKITWRVGNDQPKTGEGKRLASNKAWSGLGKKSAARDRTNAKIRERQVRMIDLERVLPVRSFSNALYRKANVATKIRLDSKVEKAFSYIFELTNVELYRAGSHINRSCFFVKSSEGEYSSYNAASGEEAVIYLLLDIMDPPKDSLILIDEIEAGFHPSIQRKIADIVQYISWREKKQFIITTHSPTLMSAFPIKSRVFIEATGGRYRAIAGISKQAAASKMDSVAHPLVSLYCEDELASFLIKKIMQRISTGHTFFDRLFQIIESGAVDKVENDYIRHKRNFSQMRNKIGFAAIIDGDYKNHSNYSGYYNNPAEMVDFLYPYEAPEKFLVRSYLRIHPNTALCSALELTDHHCLFQEMVNRGIAADLADARGQCYAAFEQTTEFAKHEIDIKEFLIKVAKHFSEQTDGL